MRLASPEARDIKTHCLRDETQAAWVCVCVVGGWGWRTAAPANLLTGEATLQRGGASGQKAHHPAGVSPRPCQANCPHPQWSRTLLQIVSQSWDDSLPPGKCPRRWHRSPFPAGSALSEPSAEELEPSGPHPRGLTAESQASTGRTPALCADHALPNASQLPAEGREVGLTRSSLAWPPPPNAARSGFRWSPAEAGQCSTEGWRKRHSFGQVQVTRYPACLWLLSHCSGPG